jgi:hypothetical protein
MREELDMQAPLFRSEARRTWQKSSLRYAVAGLSQNEPSKDAKYFHLLSVDSKRTNQCLRTLQLRLQATYMKPCRLGMSEGDPSIRNA